MLDARPGSDLCQQLISLTERLSALAEAETARLRARVFAPAPEAEERERLGRVYRTEVSRIRQNPALIAAARAQDRAALTKATQRLEQVTEAHAAAVEAFRKVSEGLVRTIVEEVARAREAPRGYGPKAASQPSPRTGQTGVALNAKA